ncbi:hypothetical protein SAY87_030157 [Trapa incisa]|uniref:Coenzyme Q-binding protein COQ10 START domain-containing protein n=1 Tax=Trapa incisa TaxID=236973 RepID=A0AAN7QA79_9MYRT|nr:hypothetical protein SAY87_030157 [Trapa incisa]
MVPGVSLGSITYQSFSAAPITRLPIPSSSVSSKTVIFTSPKHLNPRFRSFSSCCSKDGGSISLHENAAGEEEREEFGDCFRDSDTLLDGGEESISGDGVYIEIVKTGKRSRRIVSRVGIDATLDTIWGILTEYERLADFIPGLAVSQLMEKREKFARLYQIGQQDLAFGLKFNAKGVVDCYEKDLESLPSGQRRDIDFKMIQGDFQVFQGKWSVEQFHGDGYHGSNFTCDRNFQSALSYVVDVEPKLWLPVQLIEGRICKEITTNLVCIREQAIKASGTLSA